MEVTAACWPEDVQEILQEFFRRKENRLLANRQWFPLVKTLNVRQLLARCLKTCGSEQGCWYKVAAGFSLIAILTLAPWHRGQTPQSSQL